MEIHTGDCIDVLETLADASVHCCMTSPPYWGLRDYGEDVEATFGGEPDCSHDWVSKTLASQGGHNTEENPPDVGGNNHTQETRLRGGGVESEICERCGAWHGQLGLEPDARLYVQHIVEVLDAVKRVLRPDGSLWLNLGDTYDTDGGGLGLGKKQKSLIPHRVAIALQDAGWIIRNDVTWAKPNPMPSSVKDRLNTTTEQIFHLTPKPDYWYDLDAIREPHAESSKSRISQNDGNPNNNPNDVGHPDGMHKFNADQLCHPAGKNPGDVFEVMTKPFPDAHFAVYPSELCEKPIKATAPLTVCAECGAPTCDCDTDATDPGIVLDPFAGAGTTLLKAKQLGRDAVGIEINPEYADMARARIGLQPHNYSNVRDDDAQGGLEQYE